MTDHPAQFSFAEIGPWPFLYEVGYELGSRQSIGVGRTRAEAHAAALLGFKTKLVKTPKLMDVLPKRARTQRERRQGNKGQIEHQAGGSF